MKRSVFGCAGILSVILIALFAMACPVSAGNEDVIYSTSFEGGLGDWSADNGMWEVGPPAVRTGECFEGGQCAGTQIGPIVGRLISPPVVLPAVAGEEELLLSFHHWYSYGPDFQGSGTIEVSTFDFQKDGWSQWEPVGDSFIGKNVAWSLQDVDLSAYAGKTVRVAFKSDSGQLDDAGWHVDAVEIRKSGDNFAIEGAVAAAPVVTSFKINNGAATTTRRKVNLQNTVSGTPTMYKASESPTFTGATWKTYSNKPSFTLSAGPGYKTVYFKVKNGSGQQSAVVNDRIKLTNPLGGTWNGHWDSDYGESGSLTLVGTQTATGYTGKLTIRNTECGTFSNLPATLTLNGNVVTCTAYAYCSGSSLKLKFTQGILTGNTINGYYNVYRNGSFYDSGSFFLSK